MSGDGRKKARRSYLPAVEALEALRLFSGAAPTLPTLGPAAGLYTAPIGADSPSAPPLTNAAWDHALSQANLLDLLSPTTAPLSTADARDIQAGLAQLDRYLGRAWSRAGIPAQQQDDCTQAVYVTLLQNLGRDRFDAMTADIGRNGVRDVLSRETADGPDFFRAIDTVKKRAQRERTFQSLDQANGVTAASADNDPARWRATLQEAMARTLSPRESALIQATLSGETPAEIAAQWGVAPKTVSNEKTRALQKLREFLVADLSD